MFNMLLACRIPSQIVKRIKGLYLHTVSQVVTEDGNTNLFPIIAGVQQGDTMALYLFIIVLDYIMRITNMIILESHSTDKKEDVAWHSV